MSLTRDWVSTFTTTYTSPTHFVHSLVLLTLTFVKSGQFVPVPGERHFLSFLLNHLPERYFIKRIFLIISHKAGFQTSFYMWMIECIQCYSHRQYFHDCMGSKAPETQRIKANWTMSSWVLKTDSRLEFRNTGISNRALALGGI